MLSGLAVEMSVVGRSVLARLHSTAMSVMSSPCSEHHLAASTHADLQIFYRIIIHDLLYLILSDMI